MRLVIPIVVTMLGMGVLSLTAWVAPPQPTFEYSDAEACSRASARAWNDAGIEEFVVQVFSPALLVPGGAPTTIELGQQDGSVSVGVELWDSPARFVGCGWCRRDGVVDWQATSGRLTVSVPRASRLEFTLEDLVVSGPYGFTARPYRPIRVSVPLGPVANEFCSCSNTRVLLPIFVSPMPRN